MWWGAGRSGRYSDAVVDLRDAGSTPGGAFRLLPLEPGAHGAAQQACLRLAAADKSDWEIGRILGIAEETACQYLKRARAAYDVPTRTQLVVHGLRDGWIGYGDAIPPIGGMG